MSEKLTLADDEEEFDNEPWAKTASTSRSGSSSKKTEWDNLLDDLDDSGEIDLTAKLHHKLDTAGTPLFQLRTINVRIWC